MVYSFCISNASPTSAFRNWWKVFRILTTVLIVRNSEVTNRLQLTLLRIGNKRNYLVALSRLLRNIPKQVMLDEVPQVKLWPLYPKSTADLPSSSSSRYFFIR